MEIIFLVSVIRIGGAQYYVKRNSGLLSSYFKVSVFFGKEESDIFGKDTKVYKHQILGLHIPFNPIAIISIVNRIKKRSDLTLVCNSFAAGVNGRIAGLICRTPTVYISHGWSYQYKPFFSRYLAFWIEKILGNKSRLICISESDRDIAIRDLKIKKKNVFFVRNRVFSSTYKNKLKLDWSISTSIRKVIYVGRKEAPKRIDLYIALCKSMPDISFYLVGVVNTELTEIPPNLFILGKIPDFNDYNEYDLFCLFSDSEGLPLSAIEASGVGIPLLLSDVGGCRELIRYKNGLVTKNEIQSILHSFKLLNDNFSFYKKRAEIYRYKFVFSDTNESLNLRLINRLLTSVKSLK